MKLTEVINKPNFKGNNVFVDKDLNVYSKNFLRRIVIAITNLFSDKYDKVKVAEAVNKKARVITEALNDLNAIYVNTDQLKKELGNLGFRLSKSTKLNDDQKKSIGMIFNKIAGNNAILLPKSFN